MSEANQSWPETNQRYLMARVQLVRLALERHAASERKSSHDESQSETVAKDQLHQEVPGQAELDKAVDLVEQAASALPAPAALDHLIQVFGLSPFERDVLLLCAGMELDGSFASLCATAQGGVRRNYATLSLALGALPQAHWTALTPAAALRRWRLIEVASGGDTLLPSQLRIDERVLHYLAGVSYL